MKKKKEVKSPSYDQGYKDAQILFEQGHSLWYVCSVLFNLGLRRKSETAAKRLRNYCDGFNDCVEKKARSKGIKTNESLYLIMSVEDIGK
jgi:hypothetical protein